MLLGKNTSTALTHAYFNLLINFLVLILTYSFKSHLEVAEKPYVVIDHTLFHVECCCISCISCMTATEIHAPLCCAECLQGTLLGLTWWHCYGCSLLQYGQVLSPELHQLVLMVMTLGERMT